jgi:hypothetical protein
MSLINPIVKLNNSLISILENPVIKYSLIILLTVLILFIDKIEVKYIEVFDNTLFKIIYALFIAYTVCIDPIYAILLTTFMIMVIQELHLRKSLIALLKLNNNNSNNNDNINHKKNLKNIEDIINKSNSQDITFKDSEISDIINEIEHDIENNDTIELVNNKNNSNQNKETMTNMTEEIKNVNDKYYEDPAFKTITNNLQEKNRINDTQLFVTDDDLMKAQTNKLEQGLISNGEVKLCNVQGYSHLPNSGSDF